MLSTNTVVLSPHKDHIQWTLPHQFVMSVAQVQYDDPTETEASEHLCAYGIFPTSETQVLLVGYEHVWTPKVLIWRFGGNGHHVAKNSVLHGQKCQKKTHFCIL